MTAIAIPATLIAAQARLDRANAVLARAERGHGSEVLFRAQWAYRVAAAEASRQAKAHWHATHPDNI